MWVTVPWHDVQVAWPLFVLVSVVSFAWHPAQSAPFAAGVSESADLKSWLLWQLAHATPPACAETSVGAIVLWQVVHATFAATDVPPVCGAWQPMQLFESA